MNECVVCASSLPAQCMRQYVVGVLFCRGITVYWKRIAVVFIMECLFIRWNVVVGGVIYPGRGIYCSNCSFISIER